MIRTRFKKVLLVAPDLFPDQLIADHKNVRHITNVNSIFPSLFELNPDMILLDYDMIGTETEKIIRRIRINKFYSKLKIYCYKSVPNTKTDGLLKVLGVDQFIYQADMAVAPKTKTIGNTVNSIIDTSIIKWVSGVAN